MGYRPTSRMEAVFEELCRKYGWCLRAEDREALIAAGPQNRETITDSIIRASSERPTCATKTSACSSRPSWTPGCSIPPAVAHAQGCRIEGKPRVTRDSWTPPCEAPRASGTGFGRSAHVRRPACRRRSSSDPQATRRRPGRATRRPARVRVLGLGRSAQRAWAPGTQATPVAAALSSTTGSAPAGGSSSGIVGSARECRSTNAWTAAEALVSRSGVSSRPT